MRILCQSSIRISSGILMVVIVVLTLLLGPGVSHAQGADPEIAVVPDHGPPGSTVEVYGFNFPLSSIAIGFSQGGDDWSPVTVPLNDDGTFTGNLVVPDDAVPGDAEIYALSSAGRIETDFVVDLATTQPRGRCPKGFDLIRIENLPTSRVDEGNAKDHQDLFDLLETLPAGSVVEASKGHLDFWVCLKKPPPTDPEKQPMVDNYLPLAE